MGTTLTGTTPQDTYDSLIKVTDNGPIGATAKYLSDGLGNDSALALSTGNIGIGTTSPSRNLHILGGAGIGTVLKLEAGSGAITYLQLAYNGATNAQSGYISYDSSANMGLFTNDNEKVRITSTGNVGIGTTDAIARLTLKSNSANTTTVGGNTVELAAFLTRSNDVGGIRFGTDGSSNAYIYSSESGGILNFGTRTAPNNNIIASVTANGLTFNGDTAAANALDDYEEGTFTATLKGSTTDPTTAVTTTGYYTKIGRQVSVSGYFSGINNTGASGAVRVSGLPFTSAVASPLTSGSSIANLFDFQGKTSLQSYISSSSTILDFLVSADDVSFANLAHTAGTGRSLSFALTYFV